MSIPFGRLIEGESVGSSLGHGVAAHSINQSRNEMWREEKNKQINLKSVQVTRSGEKKKERRK